MGKVYPKGLNKTKERRVSMVKKKKSYTNATDSNLKIVSRF